MTAANLPAHPNATHGHCANNGMSPTYRSWQGMRGRCFRSTHHEFALYGGRGITVCERWSSFELFLADMGLRPAGMTIDRIDVNGDYCPENCRWATHVQQQRNRTNNKLTSERVALLKARVLAGASAQRAAIEFGVSRAMVRKIIAGKAWANV